MQKFNLISVDYRTHIPKRTHSHDTFTEQHLENSYLESNVFIISW